MAARAAVIPAGSPLCHTLRPRATRPRTPSPRPPSPGPRAPSPCAARPPPRAEQDRPSTSGRKVSTSPVFDVLTMSAPELRSRPCRQQLRPVTLPGKQLFGRVDHRQHRKSPTFAAVDDGANVLEHVEFVRRADHHLHRNRVGAVPQGDFHRADQGEVVLRGDDVGQVEDRAAPVGVLPPDTARQAGVEDHCVGAAGDDLPNRGCLILDTRDRALNHPVVERHHDRLSGACVDYAHVAHGFSDVDHARAVSPAARRVSSILSSRIQERNPGNTHIGDLGKMAVMSEYRPYKWPAAPLEIVLPGLVNSNLNASMTLSDRITSSTPVHAPGPPHRVGPSLLSPSARNRSDSSSCRQLRRQLRMQGDRLTARRGCSSSSWSCNVSWSHRARLSNCRGHRDPVCRPQPPSVCFRGASLDRGREPLAPVGARMGARSGDTRFQPTDPAGYSLPGAAGPVWGPLRNGSGVRAVNHRHLAESELQLEGAVDQGQWPSGEQIAGLVCLPAQPHRRPRRPLFEVQQKHQRPA